MKTKDLIGWVKEISGIISTDYDEKHRDEVIKRLERYEGLKSMNEGLLDFLGDVSNSLKKHLTK